MTDMSIKQNSHLLVLSFSALLSIIGIFSTPVYASSHPDASLTNTYWKLLEINEQPASLGAENKELHMILTGDGSKVRGFSGCNRFMGSYKQDHSQIQFGPLAGTMMACMEGMEQEHNFLRTLESSERFTISGEKLTLYDADNKLTMRFESVYLQ